MESVAMLAGLFAGFGALLALAGLFAALRFAHRPRRPSGVPEPVLEPVTLLKPLCGPEPELEEALASFCRQDHPQLQIVFGLQSPDDPAEAIVRRLQARFPQVDIGLVVDATPHGMNRKIANLLNMLPRARHDVLVFVDSDQHVAPDYLRQVQAALAAPGVGLVTALNVGRPTVRGWAARLGTTHLSHTFLPGALLSRMLGRQDCLGTTMALRRETLCRVGGLQALCTHLADDNVLGQLVRGLGLTVALVDSVPVTAVPERSLRELWSHELRWARTIGALAPLAYAASSLQYPIAWAALACLLSGFQPWALLVLSASWGARAVAAFGIDRALRRKVGHRLPSASPWLLPVRDLLSVAEIIVSYRCHKVVWRGHAMRADNGRRRVAADLPSALRGVSTGIVGGVALAIGWLSLAVAQPPTQAQKQAIQQSCRADYQAHCASVPPGGSAALACLKDNAASLGAPCQAALGAAGSPSVGSPSADAPGAAPLSPPHSSARPPAAPASRREQAALLRQACGADYRSLCHGVRPGGGAAIACLRANAGQLSAGCQHALMSLPR